MYMRKLLLSAAAVMMMTASSGAKDRGEEVTRCMAYTGKSRSYCVSHPNESWRSQVSKIAETCAGTVTMEYDKDFNPNAIAEIKPGLVGSTDQSDVCLWTLRR